MITSTLCNNFNTSHVTVYQYIRLHLPYLPKFQYISCYCLSFYLTPHYEFHFYFNTSHVTVYLHNDSGYILRRLISIHLMLLFIIFFNLSLFSLKNFNTSHVTVYLLTVITPILSRFIFQYISCYCLSHLA